MPDNYLEKPKGPSSAEEVRAQRWLNEMALARKREKGWLKDARRAVEIYEGDRDQGSDKSATPFNILYSNSETLAPALYNSTPRPDVQARYKNETPAAIAAASLCQTYLTYFIDNGDPRYQSFDEAMVGASQAAIVAGRGVIWYKYDATVESDEQGPSRVSYETVCQEMVPYDRILEGYGRSWQEVPFLARVHFYTREEAKKDFGEAGAKTLIYLGHDENDSRKDDQDGPLPVVENAEGVKLAMVYEIWDKRSRKVLYLGEGSKSFAKEIDDPLNLQGFYPTPEPLKLFRRLTSTTPQTLYALYENQATELNRVTTRIQRIIEALKVRGFYDQRVGSIARALEQEDNVLLPVTNVAAMAAMGGKLENAIFTFPIEKLVTVLQQLYLQREAIKQIIYEITGISDILRGASVASETATAQNLKDRWGSLRLKRFQKEIARYVRDSLRIVAEIAFSKLKPETIVACTGSKLPTQAQQQQAAMIAQQAAQAGMQPPEDPILSMPSLEEVLSILQSDLLRRYNVDIEANSTIDAEATEDKADINEFMQALSQFLGGVAPMIENGTLPFDAAKSMLLAIVKRFRFGREVEETIRTMKQPAPQSSPEDMKKQQAELEKAQDDLKSEQDKLKQEESKLKELKMDIELAMKELEMLKKELAMEQKLAMKEAQTFQKTLAADMQVQQTQMDAKNQVQQAQNEVTFAKQSAALQGQQQDIEDANAQGAREAAQRDAEFSSKRKIAKAEDKAAAAGKGK